MMNVIARTASNATRRGLVARTFTTVQEAVTSTADDAMKFSGYSSIDFTISEDSKVYDAVQKFAAFNIGCLVTVDGSGTLLRTTAVLLSMTARRVSWFRWFCYQ
jgi:predicted transcriptional regulator